jgi:N6-L-threonylcarbamoyladenine synthase
MLVLGIDTSCDDTSVALAHEGRVLSSVVSSQKVHSSFGGVIPELASRDHIKNIIPVLKKAIKQANVTLNDIQGIAVTYGPGLMGSLLVGLSFAKSLSLGLEIPFFGVNHLEGHIFSLFVERRPECPFLVLLVSGGHTELIIVKKIGEYIHIGETLDDAGGEAFDKVAGILGLAYPGGPEIERLAKHVEPNFIHFPISKVPGYNFSFSGLKTSVLYYTKKNGTKRKEDIAASFQEAVIDSLIEKTVDALENYNLERVGVCGGVAENRRLREKLEERVNKAYFPPSGLSTDNGVMIALCGEYYLSRGITSPLSLSASPRVKLISSSSKN